MAKIYAKTVAPERMQVPSWYFEGNETLIIAGNRDYCGVNAHIIEDADKLCADMYYEDEYDACSYDKADGSEFTDGEFNELRAIAKEKSSWDETHHDFRLAYLSKYFGEKYVKHTIRGCCQGEWQHLYCPESMTSEERDYIEAVYFGTGTEVIVHEDDTIPEWAEDVYGGAYYYNEYDADKLKALIAKEHNASPEDVVLWMFDGYKQVAKYKRA